MKYSLIFFSLQILNLDVVIKTINQTLRIHKEKDKVSNNKSYPTIWLSIYKGIINNLNKKNTPTIPTLSQKE